MPGKEAWAEKSKVLLREDGEAHLLEVKLLEELPT